MEGIVLGQICKQMLSATLYADEHTKRNDTIAPRHISAAAHIRYRHGSFLSHCREKGGKNTAVDGTGYVVMLEGKSIGVGFLFVEDKRSDHSAGSNLREVMQNVVKIGNVGALGSTVIHLPSFFFCHDNAGFAVFLKLFANSGFVKHHRALKAGQIFFIDLCKQFGNSALNRRIV